MVTQYGMSDKVGMIQYGSDDDEVFIGRDLAHTKSYGNGMADTIDSEVKRITWPDICSEARCGPPDRGPPRYCWSQTEWSFAPLSKF